MPRPRTPSNILELRGAYKLNPQRRRVDLEGVGDLPAPPSCFTDDEREAWETLAAIAPPGTLTGSDGPSLAAMAILYARMLQTRSVKDIAELRAWVGQYGFSAAGRAKLGVTKQKPQTKFSEFKRA